MAGSGSRKTAEDIKNIDMMTVRNKTQQEVTDVIFPNGLTVGLADPRFNNGMRSWLEPENYKLNLDLYLRALIWKE